MASRSIFIVFVATVVALVAVVISSNAPVDGPAPALAGPCAAEPELYFADDPPGTPELQVVRLFGKAGGGYNDMMAVETNPNPLPEGKPPVTIVAEGNPGHPGIANSFTPSQSNGSFDTQFLTVIDESVPAGVYDYNIKIDCHGEIRTVPYTVYVDTCPAPVGRASFGVAGAPTPSPAPFPDECEEPTTSPTPSPTPSPTASPTDEPDGLQVAWGNSNCSGADHLEAPNPVDSLFVLRADANLPTNTGDCPDMGAEIDVAFGSPHIWGDFDCTNGLIPVDSLKILRYDAALSVTQAGGCPEMGEAVTVTEQ